MKNILIQILTITSLLAANVHLLDTQSQVDSTSATNGDFALIKKGSIYVRHFFDGNEFVPIEDKSQVVTFTSCKEILDNGLNRGDGIYTINPNENEFEVYCDMTTDGGGWTLLMRVKDNSQLHATSNNQEGDIIPRPTSTEVSKFSTDRINVILAGMGDFIMKMKCDDESMKTPYLRGSQADEWGSNLDASNLSNISAWLKTLYKTKSDALSNTSGYTGNYTGANHYYPTSYSHWQIFFNGHSSANGYRCNNTWDRSGFSDNSDGTLWVQPR